MIMKLSALLLRLTSSGRILGVFLVSGALLSILAIGCGAPTDPESTATNSQQPSSIPATPLSVPATAVPPTSSPTLAPAPEWVSNLVGATAPNFPLKLFQGEDTLGDTELNLSDIFGQPIVLNFWARFCGPCWSEMPELQDFYEERGDQLNLLGIDVGQFTGLGSPKDAGRLLDSLGVTYPAGYTDDATITSKYRIQAMPTTVFIDSQGVVFQSWTGAIDRRQLEIIVDRMLEEE